MFRLIGALAVGLLLGISTPPEEQAAAEQEPACIEVCVYVGQDETCRIVTTCPPVVED